MLKTLLDRRLIRIAGRKPVVGQPFLYRTTREFLMHFGLQRLDDLPPLEEFEETFGADFAAAQAAGEEEAALDRAGVEDPETGQEGVLEAEEG